MEPSEQILHELRSIKWLNRVIAICLLLLALSWVWQVGRASSRSQSSIAYSRASNELSNRSSTLLGEGKAKDVIALTEEYEKKYPLDPYVYWFRARAYYQLGQYDAALKALAFAEELCPLWRKEYTAPFTERIKQKMAEKKTPAPQIKS